MFHPIDYETWDRRELYEYFKGTLINTTVQLDIFGLPGYLKRNGIHFYPAVIHCVASVVHDHAEYRYGYDENGKIGTLDELHIMYTVPRAEKPELFSMCVTKYRESFEAFHQGFLRDSEAASQRNTLFPPEPLPRGLLCVSSMPQLPYTSFSFGGTGEKKDLFPFVVIGRYEQHGDQLLLPVSGEFAHCVHDGYHVTRFFHLLQERLQHMMSLEA